MEDEVGRGVINISEIKTTKCNTHWIVFERFLEKQIAQNFVAVFSQFVLLLLAAMVLEAKNDRIFRRDERCVPHRVNHVLEENVGAHSFAMRNYRLLVLPFAIPTIQLDAPSSSTRSKHAFTNSPPFPLVPNLTCNRPTTPACTSRRCSCRRTDGRTNTCCGSS